MIPLVTAIEDLDGVLPDDVRICWSEGSPEGRYALTLENERVSVRLQIEGDALIQRGEPYRQFLACVAKVMAVMAPPPPEPVAGDDVEWMPDPEVTAFRPQPLGLAH